MTRVKFLQSTKHFGKGACVYLHDEDAKIAIKLGDAQKIDDVPVAKDAPPTQKVMRITILKDVVVDKIIVHAKDARKILPEPEAKALIAAGNAKEFPFNTADDYPVYGKEKVEPELPRGRRTPVTV